MFIAMMGVVNKCLTLISQKKCEEYKTGSLNLDEVHFDFNGDEWANLTKVAVFVAENGKVYDVPLVDNTCVVPYEVYKSTQLSAKNSSSISSVAIGVYGITIDNETIEKILPTNLVTLPLGLGSYFPGESPSPLPNVDQWQIYIQQIEDLANNASTSAQSALVSEQNAANSAQEALTSAQNASNSAQEASTSAQNASLSAQNALTSEQSASTSAQEALTSAQNANNSAQDALASKQSAASSAQDALASKQSALTSAQNAALSEQNAASSAQDASASKQSASSSAQNALTSEQNALSSAQNASISEQGAMSAAKNASKSKEDAEAAANKAEGLVAQINSLEFYLNPQTGDLSYSMD